MIFVARTSSEMQLARARSSRFEQKLFCLRVEVIVAQPTTEKRVGVATAADSGQIGQVCGRRAGGGILKRLEGRILLQALGQVLGGLRVELVGTEAAKKSRSGPSGAADSCQVGQVCGVWWRT